MRVYVMMGGFCHLKRVFRVHIITIVQTTVRTPAIHGTSISRHPTNLIRRGNIVSVNLVGSVLHFSTSVSRVPKTTIVCRRNRLSNPTSSHAFPTNIHFTRGARRELNAFATQVIKWAAMVRSQNVCHATKVSVASMGLLLSLRVISRNARQTRTTASVCVWKGFTRTILQPVGPALQARVNQTQVTINAQAVLPTSIVPISPNVCHVT